eukprot:g12727.t1
MGMSMPMGGNGMPQWPFMQPFMPQQPATQTTSGSSQEGPQSGSQGQAMPQGQIMPPGNMTQVPPIFGFPSGMGFGEGGGLSPRLQGGGLRLQGKLSADVRIAARRNRIPVGGSFLGDRLSQDQRSADARAKISQRRLSCCARWRVRHWRAYRKWRNSRGGRWSAYVDDFSWEPYLEGVFECNIPPEPRDDTPADMSAQEAPQAWQRKWLPASDESLAASGFASTPANSRGERQQTTRAQWAHKGRRAYVSPVLEKLGKMFQTESPKPIGEKPATCTGKDLTTELDGH